MLKKRQLTNRLQPTTGGWVASRHVDYVGISTVYGKEYYQITPMVNGIEWSDMLKWCFDMFGPSGTDDRPGVWSYNERWYANNGMFLFKDKKDCEWFLLRWQ